MEAITAIPASLKRLSIPFWGGYSSNAVASGSSGTLTQEEQEEGEVEASLVGGGLHKESSFATASPFPSLAKISSTRVAPVALDDLEMGGPMTVQAPATYIRSPRGRVGYSPVMTSEDFSFSSTRGGTVPPPDDEEHESQQSQIPKRSASPTPTEVDEPDAEYLAEMMKKHGIKVRDFALEPLVDPVPELFDQYDGFAEYEYRLDQTPRTYPITGKVLRRLLDIGWITMDEVQRRCHDMDMEELRKCDQKGPYPYVLRWKGLAAIQGPQNDTERIIIRGSRRHIFSRFDRHRRYTEIQMLSDEAERQEAQARLRAFYENQRRELKGKGIEKRMRDGEGAEPDSTESPKRMRFGDGGIPLSPVLEDDDEFDLTSEPWMHEYWASQPSSQGFGPPAKQYPAPLSEYDPELYPEAAAVISSQGRRAVTPPPRIATPPIEEPSQSQNPSQGRPLVHPKKGLRRTLSRQQTFTQL